MESAIIFILFCVICTLLYYMHKQTKQHQDERKDLLDRVMSKDFTQYKEYTVEPVKYDPVDVSEEEEYNREIEAMKQ